MNFTSFCEGTSDLGSVSTCYPATASKDLAEGAAKSARKAADLVIEQFYYKVDYNFEANGTSKQSSNASEIEQKIVESFQKMRPILEMGSKILSIIMALYFLTILHKAYKYISEYVQDTSFDNHYLNESLEKYLTDGKRTLRRSEVRKLVRIWQWKRTTTENQRIFYSLITSAVYTSTALCILFFNAFFYYTLVMIRDYGESEVEFEGSTLFVVNVEGDGFMKGIIEVFLESYHFASNLTTVTSNEKCLPDPVKPDREFLVNMCVLSCFVLFYFTIIAQTWVLRFRHVICGMFFEGSETSRLHYLVNKLTYQIENREMIIAQNVLRSFQEDKTRKQFLEFGIVRKFSKMSRGVHGYCHACRRTGWGRHKKIECSDHFINCQEITIKATFCIPCSFEIYNSCILCRLEIVDLESQAQLLSPNLLSNIALKPTLELPVLGAKKNKVGPAPINPTDENDCTKA